MESDVEQQQQHLLFERAPEQIAEKEGFEEVDIDGDLSVSGDQLT